MTATTRLSVDGLTVEMSSGGYVVRPLDELALHAEDGELVVVLGPSGCGKTTLLSCLAGLLTPSAGTICFDDLEVTSLRGTALADYRRYRVGVVFQAFNLISSLTAKANVAVPLRLSGVGRVEADRRASELLDLVGLSDRSRHRPAELSGGQQQRVAIARALVHDAPLLLADEPTAHLDHIQVEGVLRLLRQIAAPGRVVVVATHDDRITKLADRVLELGRGAALAAPGPRQLELGSGQVLFEQGDVADLVYVVSEGSLEVFRRLAAGGEEHVSEVPVGGYVGELGPLLNLPRSASVRATEPSVVIGYGVTEFRRLFPGSLPSGPEVDLGPGGSRPASADHEAGPSRATQ